MKFSSKNDDRKEKCRKRKMHAFCKNLMKIEDKRRCDAFCNKHGTDEEEEINIKNESNER